MFSNGIFLVLVRFYDPFYRFIIKQQFYEIIFGRAIDEKSDGIKTQVLSSFLTSSLNIELVYIILAGITRLSHDQNSKNKLRIETFNSIIDKQTQREQGRTMSVCENVMKDSDLINEKDD